MTISREQIAAVVRDSLVEHFSRTFRKKVGPREFRSVRTVRDLVDAIERLQAQ